MSNPQVPMADPNAPAVQLDNQNSVVQTDQPSVPATSENTAGQGPVAAIPPVQQSVTVNGGDNNAQQMPTEDADTSKLGLNPNDPKNKEQAVQPYQVPPNDPGVKQASRINKIATMLTGGPHFTTTVDPVTGKVSRTQNQVSTKSLLLAVAMEALGGAAAGLTQKGPGNEGKAFAAGFQNGQQNQQASQQGQQEQDQQASQDLARQAAVANANFTTHSNAIKLTQLDYEQHKEWVADSAPVIENLRNVGAVQDSGVHESDLLSKYHVTKDMAIPDGVVPHIGADGKVDGYENTYTVIDPKAKIQLPDNIAQEAAELRIPGTFKMVDGKAVPQEFVGSAPIKASLVVDLTQKVSGAKLTQAQFDKQLAGLNDGDDQSKFEMNLKSSIADGSLTTKGLQTISKYASLPLNQIADTMRKDKVDSGIIGQFLHLMPEGAIEKAKIAQTNQESDAKAVEARKNLVVGPNNYEDVLAAKDKYSPDQVAAAQSMDKLQAKKKANDAYSQGASHEQGVIDVKKRNGIPLTASSGNPMKDMVNDPKVAAIPFDPNAKQTDASGANTAYMNALQAANPDLAAEVQAIGEGRTGLSKYGLAKGDGQRLQAIVSRAFGNYDWTKAESYDKLRKSFTSGKDADQIEAGNTTMLHAGELFDAINLKSDVPFSTWAASRNEAVQQLVEEVNSAYTKGVLHEDKRAKLEKDMASNNPYVAKSAIQEVMKLLSDKVGQKAQTWRRGKPSKVVPDFQVITPEAADAFHHVMNKDIDTSLMGIPTDDFSTQGTDNGGVHLLPAPSGAVHTMHGTDGNLYYVDANQTPLGYAMKKK